jgi:hypothetical protein
MVPANDQAARLPRHTLACGCVTTPAAHDLAARSLGHRRGHRGSLHDRPRRLALRPGSRMGRNGDRVQQVIWLAIWLLSARDTASYATDEDSSRAISDMLILSACIASLAAVALVLAHGHSVRPPGPESAGRPEPRQRSCVLVHRAQSSRCATRCSTTAAQLAASISISRIRRIIATSLILH